ncbi:extracellular solute-binding protein [Paracoccus pantotrophus]|uniref:extracellular solute-binding protein n=1 Tax=Paracoccus pantotrophus TaxID=82367 RepID=UPI0035AEC831
MKRRGFMMACALAILPLPALAQDGGKVVIYTPNNAQAVEAVTEVFSEKAPELSLSTITGGSGQLLRRVEAEASAPQGDLFWNSSENTLAGFREYFEPYASPEAEAIQDDLKRPESPWTATNLHVVVGMVNTDQLGELPAPTKWQDFLDPAWKGKVAIADPNNSSTAFTILWGFEKLMGTEALKQLAANVVVNSSASAVLRSVGQGEFAAGFTYESNAYAFVAGGQAEIALLYPEEGTFTSPEFQALIKGGPAPEAARRAFDVMLSRDMQVALLENTFRRPSRADIDVSEHVDLPALDSLKLFPTDEAEAAANRDDFLARWQEYVKAGQ